MRRLTHNRRGPLKAEYKMRGRRADSVERKCGAKVSDAYRLAGQIEEAYAVAEARPYDAHAATEMAEFILRLQTCAA